jgi:hypothetical protein
MFQFVVAGWCERRENILSADLKATQSMFKKFKTAWQLVKICWRVLMLDKELLIFPILSIASLGLAMGIVVWPAYLVGYLDTLLAWFSDDPEAANTVTMIIVSYLVYVFTTFVYVFFNTALVACARIRFAGGDPTVADGLRAAFPRLPLVFVWAVVTATVGFILQKSSEKTDGLASFVFSFLGGAWTIAAFFVVPILVADRVGPIKAMKTSVSLIRKTWGEAMVAHVGLSAVSFVAIVPAFILIGIGVFFLESAPAVGIAVIVVAVLMIALTVLVISTLDSILTSALYVYAVNGKLPEHFEGADLEHAFGPRDHKTKKHVADHDPYDHHGGDG